MSKHAPRTDGLSRIRMRLKSMARHALRYRDNARWYRVERDMARIGRSYFYRRYAETRWQVQRLQSALHDYSQALSSVAAERDSCVDVSEQRNVYRAWAAYAFRLVDRLRSELRERAEAHDEAVADSDDADRLLMAESVAVSKAYARTAEVEAERDAAIARAEQLKAELAELRGRRCGTCVSRPENGTDDVCDGGHRWGGNTWHCADWAKKGGE